MRSRRPLRLKLIPRRAQQLRRRRDLSLGLALAILSGAAAGFFSPALRSSHAAATGAKSAGGRAMGGTGGGAGPGLASDRVEGLLRRMTLAEKVGQLTQYAGEIGDAAKPSSIARSYRELVKKGQVGSFLSAHGAALTHEWQRIAVTESRLGIPLLFAFDVIHGYRTTMPVPLAQAASWDPEVVERAQRAAAREATAAGIHWTFAPMVDVARDPRWGRIVEGAGEDPYLGVVMAAAQVRGLQGRELGAPDTLLACVKHFVAYGAAEGGRDYNTADLSKRTLREVYLPPFHAAIDAGAGSLMSAFNEVDGVPMTANEPLLRGVLRGEWGFGGIVVSDWKSVGELMQHGVAASRADAARLGLTAGVDMEMASGTYAETLADLVRRGVVPEALVDEAVRRVLTTKERLGLFDDPYRYSDTARQQREVLSADKRATARDVARRSIVLIKNEKELLPLAKNLGTLAVVGPLADDRRAALGPWSAPARADDAVSVLAGLREAVSATTKVAYAPGVTPGVTIDGEDTSGVAAALEVAKKADAVVLVLGESAQMSGEAASRASIELPGVQNLLAQQVLALGKPTVVLLMNGRPLAIPYLAEHAPAILETWFLGVETGHAVADVLFGDFSPGGRLPVTFPRATGQIPVYYNHKNTGRPGDAKESWTSKYIDLPLGPLFAFGHGLAYTRFEYAGLEVGPKAVRAGDTVRVGFTLRNVGARAGDEVVQLYARDPVASVTRPVAELKAFQRVHLEAGASAHIVMSVPAVMLAFYDAQMQHVLEPGEIELSVGSSSADIRLRGAVQVEGETTAIPDEVVLASVAVEPVEPRPAAPGGPTP